MTCINDLVYVRRLVCAESCVAQVDVSTRMVWVYIGVLSVTYYSLVELTKLRWCHTRSNVHTRAKKGHICRMVDVMATPCISIHIKYRIGVYTRTYRITGWWLYTDYKLHLGMVCVHLITTNSGKSSKLPCTSQI